MQNSDKGGRKRKAGFSTNKKVKNATRLEYKGIKFRSKLEVYCYRKLEEAGLKPLYEKTKYELIPKFSFDGEAIRACTYTPDFEGKGYIIETKGFANDAFPIKWKLFKRYMLEHKMTQKLYLVKNQKQVLECINLIRDSYTK